LYVTCFFSLTAFNILSLVSELSLVDAKSKFCGP
jgi:hypothetical protein